MGVLDDAIRQHLELKRQRGADPGEIKREEDEALGKVVVTRRASSEGNAPVGGDTEEPVGESPAEPSAQQETMAFDPIELEQSLQEPPAQAHDEQPEPAPEPSVEPAPVAEPQHDEDVEPELPEPDEGPAPSTEEPVADEVGDSDEEAEPDELEQTPDFLEDAPEHDKLWFEQKPPKDFDF